MPEFDDKVVIVSGGAMGMGRAASVAFAIEGACVVVADLNAEEGQATANAIRASGGRALFVESDVSASADARKVVQGAVGEFGGVDVLFNNVGIQPPDSYRTAADLSEKMWDRIMAVNVKSHFLMAKYSIPEMRKRGGGVIINNASVQGLQSQKLVPAYAASKGAVLSLTQNLALDFAHENIRVLAICPGSIDTPMLRKCAAAQAEGDVDDELARWGKAHPLKRIGTAEEVAEVVLFLAGDRASFMTGDRICVDGGIAAQGSWAGSD